MHLCFYLIPACFLVLPRMCETTNDVHEHFRLLVWEWQDPPCMTRSAHENAWGHNCLASGLVKTWKNKEAVKETWNPGFENVVSLCRREVYSLSSSSSLSQTLGTAEWNAETAVFSCPFFRVCVFLPFRWPWAVATLRPCSSLISSR